MEFKQLYYFVETCKRMNFAITAEALYVTPQALSKSIKTLENNLGEKLFYLNKNALILTEFGEFFLPKAQNLLAEYYAMRNEVANLSNNYKGLIRVGIVPSARNLINADFLQKFMEKFPETTIDFTQMSDESLKQGVLAHSLDLGIGVYPAIDQTLETVTLCKSGISLIMNVKNPLCEKETIRVADLDGQELIVHSDLYMVEKALLEQAQREGLNLKVRLKSSELSLTRPSMHYFNCVAISPTLYTTNYCFSKEAMCRNFAKEEKLEWGLQLLMTKSKAQYTKVQLFVESLLRDIEERRHREDVFAF